MKHLRIAFYLSLLLATFLPSAFANTPPICRYLLKAAAFFDAQWSSDLSSIGNDELNALPFPPLVRQIIPSPSGEHHLISLGQRIFFEGQDGSASFLPAAVVDSKGTPVYDLKPNSLIMNSQLTWLGRLANQDLVGGKANRLRWSLPEVSRAHFLDEHFALVAMASGDLRVISLSNGTTVDTFRPPATVANRLYEFPFLVSNKGLIGYQARFSNQLFILHWNSVTRKLEALSEQDATNAPITGGEVSQNGQKVVVYSSSAISFYDRVSNQWTTHISPANESIIGATLSSDSSHLVIGYSHPDKPQHKRIATYQFEKKQFLLNDHAHSITLPDLYVLPDGDNSSRWVIIGHTRSDKKNDDSLSLFLIHPNSIEPLGNISHLPPLRYLTTSPEQKWLGMTLALPFSHTIEGEVFKTSHLLIKGYLPPSSGEIALPDPQIYLPTSPTKLFELRP